MNKATQTNLVVSLIFLAFFCIGIIILPDYGISIDEDNSRVNGFVSLKYIYEIFFPNYVTDINQIITVQNIKEYHEQGNGVVFDLPMAFLELIFKIEDSRMIFLFRHFFVFLIFFISLVFFYKIINKRFNSNLLSLMGVLFLIFTPRIFAESFYNSKDIVFMSLFIISLYRGIIFIEKSNYKNAIFFTFFCSLAIGTRVVGVILPFLIFFIYLLKELKSNKFKKKSIALLVTILFLTTFFTTLFWPYLWENPIINFFEIIKKLSNFELYIYNFYLGDYVDVKKLPWHYPLIWQIVTIPIYYTFFFIIGFSLILVRFYGRIIKITESEQKNEFWNGDKELFDLLFLLTFILPLLAVIFLNSTMYGGWRHLYFILPSFLIVCIYGIYRLKISYFKSSKFFLYILTIVLILPTFLWMIKNHPNQNLYFNSMAGSNFSKNFEMDYWGLNNYYALKNIAKNEDKKVSVSQVNTSDLFLSKSFLDKNLRNKITIEDNYIEADYVINNYINWFGKKKNYEKLLKKDFDIYRELKIDNIVINTVYKKKTKEQ